MALGGIDVANHQGTINWGAVAGAGVEFMIAKATEGTTFRDPFFGMNWSGAKLVGLARGAYHFARADLGTSPEGEADWFLSVVEPGLEVGDFLCLDIEDADAVHPQPADLHGWVAAWVGRVTARAGFRPLLYSTASYLTAHNLAGKADLADCGLWLASWSDTPPAKFPKPPPPWEFVAIHQWSSKGRVPGIAGDVDLDLFNGTVDRLRAYGKPAAPPPPSPERTIVLGEATYAAVATYLAEIADLNHQIRVRAELVGRALGMAD